MRGMYGKSSYVLCMEDELRPVRSMHGRRSKNLHVVSMIDAVRVASNWCEVRILELVLCALYLIREGWTHDQCGQGAVWWTCPPKGRPSACSARPAHSASAPTCSPASHTLDVIFIQMYARCSITKPRMHACVHLLQITPQKLSQPLANDFHHPVSPLRLPPPLCRHGGALPPRLPLAFRRMTVREG